MRMKKGLWLCAVAWVICAAQTITPLGSQADDIGSPALSPDGRILAYSSDGVIKTRAIQGGKAIQFTWKQDDNAAVGPRWSPDGKRIAFLRLHCVHCNSSLFVKDFPTGTEQPLGEVCDAAPAWSVDGRYLIAAELAGRYPSWDPCRLVLVPLGGGARIRLAKEGDQLALTADGKRLAYAAGNRVLTVDLDADSRFSGTPQEVAKEPHSISALYWSIDGRTLVYHVENYTKAVADGVNRVIDLGSQVRISQMLPDGGALGVESIEHRALWRVDLRSTPQKPEKLFDIGWTDSDLSVSPDGQQMAFATTRYGATQIRIAQLDGSRQRVVLAAIPPFDSYGDRTVLSGVSWSPNGRWLAVATGPGIGHGDARLRLFLVPVAGGAARRLIDTSETGRAPIWSADSKAIYVVKYAREFAREDWFLADTATGRLTPVAKEKVPQLPLVPLPKGANSRHAAQAGRYLYFEVRGDWTSRGVRVQGLLAR